MAILEARTVVCRPPAAVYEAVSDLRRFDGCSEYLASIDRRGDGGVDTEYTLRFEWWLVTYAVRVRLTRVEPPDRLEFAVVDGLDATGSLELDPIAVGDGRHPGGTDGGPATEVTFELEYDPDTAADSTLRLPSLVSLDRVVDRVAPLAEREAEATVERIVRDIEGSQRSVELAVRVG